MAIFTFKNLVTVVARRLGKRRADRRAKEIGEGVCPAQLEEELRDEYSDSSEPELLRSLCSSDPDCHERQNGNRNNTLTDRYNFQVERDSETVPSRRGPETATAGDVQRPRPQPTRVRRRPGLR